VQPRNWKLCLGIQRNTNHEETPQPNGQGAQGLKPAILQLSGHTND